MEWPVLTPAISDADTPLWQFYYQSGCPTPSDPTMIWGTEVPMAAHERYLRDINAHSPVLISTPHILLRASAVALRRHPEFNRRLIHRRVYQYKDVNLLISLFNARKREVEVLLLEQVDRQPLSEVARELWRYSQQAARDELPHFGRRTIYDLLPLALTRRLLPFHLWLFNRFNWPVTSFWCREHRSAVLINYLAFKGAAPLRMYKPSRFPSDSTPFNVTLGATEQRPVAENGQVVIRPVAPLIVRADHRIVDAHDLGLFVTTLRDYLADPASIELQADLECPLAA